MKEHASTRAGIAQRAWALLLAVALCLGLVPGAAWAAEGQTAAAGAENAQASAGTVTLTVTAGSKNDYGTGEVTYPTWVNKQYALGEVLKTAQAAGGTGHGKGDLTMEDLLDTAVAKGDLKAYDASESSYGKYLNSVTSKDGAKLAVRDADGNRAMVYGERQPQPGQKPPEEARAAYRRSLEKMGGTPFFPQEVAVRGAQWFLPGSEVNELRRRALESLLAKREQPRPIPCAKVPQALLEAPARAAKQEGYAVRLAHAAQLPRETPQDAAWFIMPLAQWRDVPPELRSRTWLEAPRALFGGAEEASARAAFESRDAGFAGYVAENIAQFTTLEGLPLAGGFGLNVTNPLSAKEYAALGARMLTLSPELTLEDMARISAPVPVLALAYGHMPLMLTRACPLQNVRDCGGCDRKGELLDRKGMRFPVRCSGPAGARTVYNPIPIYMGDRLKELPVELPLLYFTIETAARVREVLALVREGLPFDGPFTRGLYYKGTN